MKVVLVTIDGLAPEVLTDPDAMGLRVPTLRRMVAEGACAQRLRSVLPSVTYPAHATLATGRRPAGHGIVTNQTFDPLRRNDGGWYWYAEDLVAPTLWQVAEAAGRRVALINWPVTVGARATWVVPEVWRAGSADDQKLTRALSTPGLLDAVAARFPDLWRRFTPPDVLDSASVDIAVHLLETAAPDLVMLHAWWVDEMQHRHGPGSALALDAIEEADAQLARLVAAAGADTRFVVVSDHGFLPQDRVLRPEVLLHQRGLVQVDARGKLVDWRAAVSVNGGSAYVYVRDDNHGVGELVRRLFEPLVGGEHVAAVHGRDEIRALGGDSRAFLWLDAQPGAAFASGLGELTGPSGGRGTHGHDPRRAAMDATLVAWGAGLPHATVAEARLEDVAPQVASWMRLTLDGAEGQPIFR